MLVKGYAYYGSIPKKSDYYTDFSILGDIVNMAFKTMKGLKPNLIYVDKEASSTLPKNKYYIKSKKPVYYNKNRLDFSSVFPISDYRKYFIGAGPCNWYI